MQHVAVVWTLDGNILKVTGPYADVDEACRAYNVPEVHRNVALEDGYKFAGPGFGPFVSIRPLTTN